MLNLEEIEKLREHEIIDEVALRDLVIKTIYFKTAPSTHKGRLREQLAAQFNLEIQTINTILYKPFGKKQKHKTLITAEQLKVLNEIK